VKELQRKMAALQKQNLVSKSPDTKAEIERIETQMLAKQREMKAAVAKVDDEANDDVLQLPAEGPWPARRQLLFERQQAVVGRLDALLPAILLPA